MKNERERNIEIVEEARNFWNETYTEICKMIQVLDDITEKYESYYHELDEIERQRFKEDYLELKKKYGNDFKFFQHETEIELEKQNKEGE